MPTNADLAELIFSNITATPDDYEKIYPPRTLPEGAMVTRVAPSPTGYLHLGTVYASLCDRFAADTSNGVFMLRIEDTDKKREVEEGVEDIVSGLNTFGIKIDEGFVEPGIEKGAYGPYVQSKRAEIYQCYVKDLIIKGLAYPCFCSEDELNEVRAAQEAGKERTGYYGRYAKCRDMSADECYSRIKDGKPFVIRLKSPGNGSRTVSFTDLIKGKIDMPENDLDLVLLKSDMIPTYHFAHAVDDHLMRTTHVIRGDEWVSSVPIHLQLFGILGFKPPKFAHISPLMKIDAETGGKRKLSKRKDPEVAAISLIEQGYPIDSVIDYLMTILSSDYEDWRKANPKADYREYKYSFKKMSVSGALVDAVKLNDVSKNMISRKTAEEVYDLALSWAKEYDSRLYNLLESAPEYAKAIFSIDRDVPKPRKDIAKWSELSEYYSYFYDELYTRGEGFSDIDTAKEVIEKYVEVYDPNDDKDAWFGKMKAICEPLGFSPDVKAYKQNPENFRGHIGDISSIIRVAVTGRTNSPDLYEIMRILGRDRVLARLNYVLTLSE